MDSCKEQKSMKVKNVFRKLIDQIASHPYYAVLVIMSLFSVFYMGSVLHNWKSISFLGTVLKPSRAGTFHFVNILTILGIVATFVALILTFHQIRNIYDRVEDYDSFYYWVERVFDEIKGDDGKNRKADIFYFIGSTILPGNISMADTTDGQDLVHNLKISLASLVRDLSDTSDDAFRTAGFANDVGRIAKIRSSKPFKHLKKILLIVPSLGQNGYEKTYEFFYKHAKEGTKQPGDWATYVTYGKNEAISLQRFLLEKKKTKSEIIQLVFNR